MAFGASMILEKGIAMNLGILAALGILLAVLVTCIVILIVVVRIFKMHDVRNADGQYSWMVPNAWSEIQENLIKTQELMAGSLAELTVHNAQISKLLGTHTDAALAMFEELKKLRMEKSDDKK